MQRRQFISAASMMAAAALSAKRSLSAARARPLRILILGGTRFIGIHLTELAVARGHIVTLFNRGETNPQLFPNLEKLRGDRNGQLDALRGRKWDSVIDDSGFVPRHVRLSAQLLAPNVRQYVFVSSVSVYASFAMPPDEGSPVGKLADEGVEKVDENTYGPLKALCEQAAETALPGRVTVLRPGYIVGPNDNSDRFTYWPARAARGGEMLAPDGPGDPIQFIDVRDLARFTLDAVEHNVVGTFNLVSPPGRFTMGDLLSASIGCANSLAKPVMPPRAVWVPAEFMQQHGVVLETDMPIWSDPTGADAAFAKVSVARALQAGLSVRGIDKTVCDTLAWQLQRPEPERLQLKAGIDTARERAVLVAWHAAAAQRSQ
ncbi:MAG TPA: NAD-dependent epimerase/dehydratase family protein [Steroidobacteraceae bacterium]|jgi:2'-hydroxyisoflavone reductase|nr:NAD-dependent epimerase/dehydratase family protein [Steroidobacteraceae bacterium]